MSSSDSIETSAPTIDQAIGQALAQLGAEQDDVTIEVLSTPRSGVLGIGARAARVRVTRRAPAGARSGVMSPPPAPPLRATPPEMRRVDMRSEPGRRPIQAPPRSERVETPREEERRGEGPERGREPREPERYGEPGQVRGEVPRENRREERREPPRGATGDPARLRDSDSRQQDRAGRGDPGRAGLSEGRVIDASDEPRDNLRDDQRSNGRAEGGPRRGRRGRGRGRAGAKSSAGPSDSPAGNVAGSQGPGGRRGPAEMSPDRILEPRDRELEQDDERDPFGMADGAGNDPRKTADLQEQAREARIFLERVLELMGEKATIEAAESDDPETLELNIKGDGSGILIGRHGQTLDAIEYMVNRLLARKIKDAAPISIDTESYRARRRRLLQRMALSKGEQAKREHITVALEPMPPRDRRIVHLALKDDPMIATRSTGDGFMRAIEIVPVDERRDPSERGSENRGRGRGRTRDPDQDKAAVGEQGGFKHGQKRIV